MIHHCWECGNVTEEKELELTERYKGEEFKIKTMGLICENGHTSLLGRHLDVYNIALADAYRETHGLLTTKQLLDFRKKLHMSQQDFADFLDTHVQSIKHWEHGRVQERSMDSLIRLKMQEYLGVEIPIREESQFHIKENSDESRKSLASAA
jgi:putative zinc finger/helix-turn-helix YgiT family protein